MGQLRESLLYEQGDGGTQETPQAPGPCAPCHKQETLAQFLEPTSGSSQLPVTPAAGVRPERKTGAPQRPMPWKVSPQSLMRNSLDAIAGGF